MADLLDWENSTSQDGFFPSSQLSSRSRSKLINDPVYGHLEVEDYMVSVIDTDFFQRLRDCKQLGMSDRVFPGATHTRFEHSIGVAHLSGKQMKHLFEKQKGILFDNESEFLGKKKIVELAGLCHDLGHGPLGHVFDLAFLRKALDPNTVESVPEVHHEHRSVKIFRRLAENSPTLDLSQDAVNAVCELILGSGSSFVEDPYLYQIVANDKNSLDVDKFDYIQRDSRNLNLKWGFDPDRLINASRVVNGDMAYHQREIYTIYDMFTTRFKLHKVVYNHRVVKAIEMMGVDALLAADPVLKISDTIADVDSFLEMSDSLLYEIERSKDPRLAKAKNILRRIKVRDIYKFVDEVLIDDNRKIAAEEIVSYQTDGSDLKADDLSVYIIKANHGMGQSNPVDNVEFFKTVEDLTSFRVRSDQISYVMPDIFEERLVRVYSKVRGKEDAIKRAFRRCLHALGINRETEVSRKRHWNAK